MSDRLFYIDGNWLTYEQAHLLGYSLLPQRLITLYNIYATKIIIKQDTGDNTFFDPENLRWVNDFAELHLYKQIKSATYYRGEDSSIYSCYIGSLNQDSTTVYLYHDFLIRSLDDAYKNYGITSYECKNIILNESNSPIVWYDSQTNKYFDDREGIHKWISSIDDIQVTLYDSHLNISHKIYENEKADYFYFNNDFIDRKSFYNNENYGIIRETAPLFKDNIVFKAYYDSYSNEYCIPNVTDIWINKADLVAIGYSFIEDTASLWENINELILPWKYKDNTVTLSFTNSFYPDLTISLPEDIESTIGTCIILPEITGVYEDANLVKWTPTKWSIGEFNTTFILTESITADLECEKMKVTLSFTNNLHSDLEIQLPDTITCSYGDNLILPRLKGIYRDSEGIGWIPLEWDIGAFDKLYTITNDLSTNLIWQPMVESLAVSLCGSMPSNSGASTEAGVSLILSADGSFKLDDFIFTKKYLADGCNCFGDRLEVWSSSYEQPIIPNFELKTNESINQMICGTLRLSGNKANRGIDLLSAGIFTGSMERDNISYPILSFENDCFEVFGDCLKVYNMDYTPPVPIVFPDKLNEESSNQMICGTLRLSGNKANRGIDINLVFNGNKINIDE